MAFDGIFCVAVAKEIDTWTGARVEKVYQSAPSCMYFQLYKDGTRANLIVSALPSRPTVAVSLSSVARPDTPTPTCMLYRKHLQNGRLAGAICIENERIIRLEFVSNDEMGYSRTRYIYCELMGKYSNLILTDDTDRILAASSVTDITSGRRTIFSGMKYELPEPQGKSPLPLSEFECKKALYGCIGAKGSDCILRSFAGISPLVARELMFAACGDCDALISEQNLGLISAEVLRLANAVYSGEFVPNAVYSEDGNGIEYSYTPIRQYGNGYSVKIYNSFSDLLGEYYGRREEAVNIGRYAHSLVQSVTTHLGRIRKKIVLLTEDFEKSSHAEEYRIKGDVITANIYRISKGDTSVTGMDYESGNEITVPLEKNLTPAKNAAKLYARYAKMKRALVAIEEQLVITRREEEYLCSVLGFIERASSPGELEDIRGELIEQGYISDREYQKKKKQSASKPLSFTTTDGLKVRVGKNNKQNDRLTSDAERNDLWFHIKGFHGSHVILHPDGDAEPSDRDYTEAAMLAAYYSEKRGSDGVEVDYTRVRFLKKPNGSPLGFVTYSKYWSAVVDAVNPFEEKK